MSSFYQLRIGVRFRYQRHVMLWRCSRHTSILLPSTHLKSTGTRQSNIRPGRSTLLRLYLGYFFFIFDYYLRHRYALIHKVRIILDKTNLATAAIFAIALCLFGIILFSAITPLAFKVHFIGLRGHYFKYLKYNLICTRWGFGVLGAGRISFLV